MKHSIATVSLSGMLPEKLRAIAAAGFDGVEIFENDLLYYEGSPKEVKQICQDLNLEITLFQPFRDFEGAPREKLAQNLHRAEKKFELMHELGVDTMLMCSNVQRNCIKDDKVIMDDLHLIAEKAAQHNIKVGYEALAWGTHVNSYRHAWSLVKAVDHPNLGIILDSFHTMSIKDDLTELAYIPKDKIFFVQLADAPLMKMDVLEWSRHFRNFPGQGEFNLQYFLSPILVAGYDGPLSLEIFNDDFRAAPTQQTAIYAKRSLLYLEELTRNHLQFCHIQVDEPLFSPPPVTQYKDVAFLEFAVDGQSRQELNLWFEQLGFQKTGQHKSKDVSLYQQGEINLVLNAEPDSFAQNYHLIHGPSLCASAFKVSHAEQALARAKQYGCHTYEGRLGPQEQFIPAILAPDGSLQYFLDNAADIHQTDFNTKPHDQPSYLNNIDHFAIGISAETMDIWTLHFKAILGFVTEHELTLADPYGLMKSKVARSIDSTVRIPLNISENKHTSIARSVSAYRGSGLQHVAFSTRDIFGTVEKLQQKGLKLLTIPDNYYDDLATKFNLESDFLNKLQQYNILYDEDDNGGSFLHVYSALFSHRFFFEVLQRFNGYSQYGANNTPVRIVAQTRKDE